MFSTNALWIITTASLLGQPANDRDPYAALLAENWRAAQGGGVSAAQFTKDMLDLRVENRDPSTLLAFMIEADPRVRAYMARIAPISVVLDAKLPSAAKKAFTGRLEFLGRQAGVRVIDGTDAGSGGWALHIDLSGDDVGSIMGTSMRAIRANANVRLLNNVGELQYAVGETTAVGHIDATSGLQKATVRISEKLFDRLVGFFLTEIGKGVPDVPTGAGRYHRVLVLDLRPSGADPTLAQNLSQIFIASVRAALPDASVHGRSEVERLLDLEKQKDLVGCDEVSCLTELAGALGADHVAFGTLGKIGSTYLLNFKLVDSLEGKTVRHVAKEIDGGPEKLIEATRRWGRYLVADDKVL